MKVVCQTMEIQGHVIMGTVPKLLEEGLRLLEDTDLLLDCSKIESVDSAAVSLMLAFRRAAQLRNHNVYVTNFPNNLSNLARLYGVEDMMPKPSL